MKNIETTLKVEYGLKTNPNTVTPENDMHGLTTVGKLNEIINREGSFSIKFSNVNEKQKCIEAMTRFGYEIDNENSILESGVIKRIGYRKCNVSKTSRRADIKILFKELVAINNLYIKSL